MDSEVPEHLLRLLYEAEQSRTKQKKRAVNSTEKVRRQLESEALAAREKYLQECQRVRPSAEDSIREVIHPWLLRLDSSGLIPRLQGLLKTSRDYEIPVSHPITHYWPYRSLLRPLRSSELEGDKPFAFTAKFITGYKTEAARQQEIQNEIDTFTSEYWDADVRLWVGKENRALTIYRTPPGGGGCGFRPERYTAEMDFDSNFLDRVNPIVVVKFADQITDRTVWRKIERFAKRLRR